MNTLLLLFVAGILLLGFEVILPGAVAGLLGALLLAAGCVFAYVEWGLLAGIEAFVGAALLVVATILIEFVWLPRTRFGKRFILKAAVDAVSQAPADAGLSLVGETAVALTPLAPTGYVSVNGRRHEAFCQSGHASSGDSLKVVSSDNFRIIVSKI